MAHSPLPVCHSTPSPPSRPPLPPSVLGAPPTPPRCLQRSSASAMWCLSPPSNRTGDVLVEARPPSPRRRPAPRICLRRSTSRAPAPLCPPRPSARCGRAGYRRERLSRRRSRLAPRPRQLAECTTENSKLRLELEEARDLLDAECASSRVHAHLRPCPLDAFALALGPALARPGGAVWRAGAGNAATVPIPSPAARPRHLPQRCTEPAVSHEQLRCDAVLCHTSSCSCDSVTAVALRCDTVTRAPRCDTVTRAVARPAEVVRVLLDANAQVRPHPPLPCMPAAPAHRAADMRSRALGACVRSPPYFVSAASGSAPCPASPCAVELSARPPERALRTTCALAHAPLRTRTRTCARAGGVRAGRRGPVGDSGRADARRSVQPKQPRLGMC